MAIHYLVIAESRAMGLLPDTENWEFCMRREFWERFPRHRLQRKPLVNDAGMHHGTCVTMHVGFANPRWWEKRSRHSRRIRNPHLLLIGTSYTPSYAILFLVTLMYVILILYLVFKNIQEMIDMTWPIIQVLVRSLVPITKHGSCLRIHVKRWYVSAANFTRHTKICMYAWRKT